MKPQILILSHGTMCTEIINSVEMIMGTLEGVSAVPLLPEMTPEYYRMAVEEKVKEMPKGSLVLVDIYGGTPFNTAMCLSHSYEYEILTGANMAMLLEADSLRAELEGVELAREVREATVAACINVKEER